MSDEFDVDFSVTFMTCQTRSWSLCKYEYTQECLDSFGTIGIFSTSGPQMSFDVDLNMTFVNLQST